MVFRVANYTTLLTNRILKAWASHVLVSQTILSLETLWQKDQKYVILCKQWPVNYNNKFSSDNSKNSALGPILSSFPYSHFTKGRFPWQTVKGWTKGGQRTGKILFKTNVGFFILSGLNMTDGKFGWMCWSCSPGSWTYLAHLSNSPLLPPPSPSSVYLHSPPNSPAAAVMASKIAGHPTSYSLDEALISASVSARGREARYITCATYSPDPVEVCRRATVSYQCRP